MLYSLLISKEVEYSKYIYIKHFLGYRGNVVKYI